MSVNLKLNESMSKDDLLKDLFSLQEAITVYVPSTININQKTDSTMYINKTAFVLSTLFGGCTTTENTGTWVSNTGELVKETTTTCKSFAESITASALNQVIELCKEIKYNLKQEAIALEVNNKMYFI